MRPAHLLPVVVVGAAFAFAAAASVTVGNAYRDGRACRNALPALEADGRLVVGSITRDAGLAGVYAVDYWVVSTGVSDHPGRLRCAFADESDGTRHLTGLELNGRPLSQARRFMLERFWLGDPEAVATGAARLRDDTSALSLARTLVGPPRPWLIGGAAAVVLAIAIQALRRLIKRPARR